MTTDKIRAAAQALLAAEHEYDEASAAYLKKPEGWRDGARLKKSGDVLKLCRETLRAALAEPAQAAPADDAVPVVAQVSTAVSLRPGRPPELLWFGPGIGLQPADYLVSQRGHLAAMEALRRENERLKADRSAQVAGVMRLVDEAMRYSGAAGDWMHEDTYAAVEAAVRKLAGGA